MNFELLWESLKKKVLYYKFSMYECNENLKSKCLWFSINNHGKSWNASKKITKRRSVVFLYWNLAYFIENYLIQKGDIHYMTKSIFEMVNFNIFKLKNGLFSSNVFVQLY